jgi:hypothetical protein
VADAVFTIEGEVRFERASFNALNLDRVVKVQYLGTGVAAAMVAEASARAEAPLDDDARPLLEADARFVTYRTAFRKADETRRQLAELESGQLPELEALARERAAVQADLTLSGAELGERLARLDAREAELRRATGGLRAGLEVLDARVQAALPDAQRAVREAKRQIRGQRAAHELALRRHGREVLQDEQVQAALWILGTVALAEQMLLPDRVRFTGEEGLLDRLAAEDTPEAPPPRKQRAAAV